MVKVTFDGEFKENIFHCSFQLKRVSHFLDFNECTLSKTCDNNAQCINRPEVFSFQCKCNEGYVGNGFTCAKIVTRQLDTEVEECKILLYQASLYIVPQIYCQNMRLRSNFKNIFSTCSSSKIFERNAYQN